VRRRVFVSVGVIDSGGFKGADSVEALEQRTKAANQRFCSLATTLELPSTYKMGIGTDAVEEAEKVCRAVMAEFPVVTFVGGKVIFAREAWLPALPAQRDGAGHPEASLLDGRDDGRSTREGDVATAAPAFGLATCWAAASSAGRA
jgi:hypothetical protein